MVGVDGDPRPAVHDGRTGKTSAAVVRRATMNLFPGGELRIGGDGGGNTHGQTIRTYPLPTRQHYRLTNRMGFCLHTDKAFGFRIDGAG